MGYYRWKCNFPAALRWAHVLIAHDEQHDEGRNRASHCRDLAETYLEAGDLNTGLALFTRLAQATPDDIWNYNALAFALPRVGLPHLALQILDHALALIAHSGPEQLVGAITMLWPQITCLACESCVNVWEKPRCGTTHLQAAPLHCLHQS